MHHLTGEDWGTNYCTSCHHSVGTAIACNNSNISNSEIYLINKDLVITFSIGISDMDYLSFLLNVFV